MENVRFLGVAACLYGALSCLLTA